MRRVGAGGWGSSGSGPLSSPRRNTAAAVIVSAPAMLMMTPSTNTAWVMTRATIRTTIPMVNEAPASAIRRRRHRSMFTVSANRGRPWQ